MIQSVTTRKIVDAIAMPYSPTPGRQPERERREHDDRILRVLDLRAVANQVGGAGDTEGAREAGADDDHDHGADDGEHDLGLDDGRIAGRRRCPAGAQRERRPEERRQRQADGGLREPGAQIADDVAGIEREDLFGGRRLCCSDAEGAGADWAPTKPVPHRTSVDDGHDPRRAQPGAANDAGSLSFSRHSLPQ